MVSYKLCDKTMPAGESWMYIGPYVFKVCLIKFEMCMQEPDKCESLVTEGKEKRTVPGKKKRNSKIKEK